MSMIEIKDLCRSFGEVHAVDHVTLNIEEGEMLCLLGPSGCGKTTLLRLLSGFLDADSGTIMLDGKDVTKLPPERRPTSLVFQNYALFPHLNVYENVAFGLKIKKLPSKEIREKVMHALDVVELTGRDGRAITQLSGGQQQRVALARALVMEPKVLLLDEPLSNLDAKLRVETRQQIRELQQRVGITSVFVTHDQEEAMSMGDKIAIMESGKLQQFGSPMELYRNPCNKFVAGFLGTPAMNFLAAVVKDGAVSVDGVTIPGMGEGLADGEYTFGVRPENLAIGNNGQMDSLKATILQMELLGANALVYLDYKGLRLCAKIEVDETLKVGQEVELTCDIKRCHLFDNETGTRV